MSASLEEAIHRLSGRFFQKEMFQQNQIFDSTYQIIGEIGKGGIGTVYLAWHLRLQKYVVLKQILFENNNEMERIRIEVDTLKSLHHPNLPQVYDFLQVGTSVYTVMDYIQGIDLESYLKQAVRCSAEDLIHWFEQLTEVLVYLHAQNPPVIHSDIKPANIIITPQNDAVLIDFNVSVSKKADTVIGLSVDYASPEQINLMQMQTMGVQGEELLDGRSDIYSLCASFYQLISWRKPSVFYGTVPLSQIETEYPEVFCEILDKGMQEEREARFSSSEEMLKAVRQMWKKTKGYKGYLAVQIFLIVISAALLSFGGYHLVHGIRAKETENFLTAYNRCIQAINDEDWETVNVEAFQFLNEYENKKETEPEKIGDVFLGIARSYTAAEDYQGALEYYEYAEGCFAKEDVRYIECLSGIAMTGAELGEELKVKEVLENAGDEGMEEDSLVMLKIYLARALLKKGDPDQSLEILDSIEISKIPAVNPGLFYVQKALAYDEKGDAVRAKNNAKQALMTIKEKLPNISGEDWEKLNRLAEK